MKHRQFSIVFHNVVPGCKPKLEESFKDATKHIIAVEPYNHEGGFHAHVFVQYVYQRHQSAVLKKCEKISMTIVAPKPEGEERSWGRVQVDQMRGSFDDAHLYLTNPIKEKKVDEDVHVKDNSHERYLKSLDNICTLFYDIDVGGYNTAYLKYRKHDTIEIPEYWRPDFTTVRNYMRNNL